MPNTTYQRSGSYGFGKVDFLRFIYGKLISPVAGTFVTSVHNLINIGRGIPNCIKQFWRLPELNQHFTGIFWPTRFDVTIGTIVSIVTSNPIGQN